MCTALITERTQSALHTTQRKTARSIPQNACLDSCVFKWFLKMSTEAAALKTCGRAFHTFMCCPQRSVEWGAVRVSVMLRDISTPTAYLKKIKNKNRRSTSSQCTVKLIVV